MNVEGLKIVLKIKTNYSIMILVSPLIKLFEEKMMVRNKNVEG